MCDVRETDVIVVEEPANDTSEIVIAAILQKFWNEIRKVKLHHKFHFEDLLYAIIIAQQKFNETRYQKFWNYFLLDQSKDCPRLRESLQRCKNKHEVVCRLADEYTLCFAELGEHTDRFIHTLEAELQNQIDQAVEVLCKKTRERYRF